MQGVFARIDANRVCDCGTVRTENLNTGVVVMKSAEDGS